MPSLVYQKQLMMLSLRKVCRGPSLAAAQASAQTHLLQPSLLIDSISEAGNEMASGELGITASLCMFVDQ